MRQRPRSTKHCHAIARALRRWLRAQGFASLVAVRAARWRTQAIQRGWPPDATPQQVAILDAIRHGSHPVAAIAEATNVRPNWRLAATIKAMAARGWVQLGWRWRTPGTGKGGKQRVVRLAAAVLESREQWESLRAVDAGG